MQAMISTLVEQCERQWPAQERAWALWLVPWGWGWESPKTVIGGSIATPSCSEWVRSLSTIFLAVLAMILSISSRDRECCLWEWYSRGGGAEATLTFSCSIAEERRLHWTSKKAALLLFVVTRVLSISCPLLSTHQQCPVVGSHWRGAKEPSIWHWVSKQEIFIPHWARSETAWRWQRVPTLSEFWNIEGLCIEYCCWFCCGGGCWRGE